MFIITPIKNKVLSIYDFFKNFGKHFDEFNCHNTMLEDVKKWKETRTAMPTSASQAGVNQPSDDYYRGYNQGYMNGLAAGI